MQGPEPKRRLIVSIDAFDRTNDTDEAIAQNQKLVKFILDTIHNGFDFEILFDDCNKATQHATPSPKSIAENALEQALTAYTLHPEFPDIRITSFDDFLVPYSKYQARPPSDDTLPDRTYIISKARNWDKATTTIVISPEAEDLSSILIDDYDIYIRPSEIDSFSEYEERTRTLDFEAGRAAQRKNTIAQKAQQRLQIIQDIVTFDRAFGDSLDDIFNGLTTAQPIANFLQNKPTNVKMPEGIQNVSESELTLSHYFAALLRKEMCPKHAKRHEEDAAHYQNELSAEDGAAEALQFIEACVQHIRINKPYMP